MRKTFQQCWTTCCPTLLERFAMVNKIILPVQHPSNMLDGSPNILNMFKMLSNITKKNVHIEVELRHDLN